MTYITHASDLQFCTINGPINEKKDVPGCWSKLLLSNFLDKSITANLQPQHASRASYLRSYGSRLQGSLWSRFWLSSASSKQYFDSLFTAEKRVAAQYLVERSSIQVQSSHQMPLA
jgi:hypothetical protein